MGGKPLTPGSGGAPQPVAHPLHQVSAPVSPRCCPVAVPGFGIGCRRRRAGFLKLRRRAERRRTRGCLSHTACDKGALILCCRRRGRRERERTHIGEEQPLVGAREPLDGGLDRQPTTAFTSSISS